ncbi:MAG: hypothetical protein KAQ98_05765 [Bacteriovoracaceae bacterium]|nr:hypothetical protein [Bacteriovoracaceae bacterium]
MDNKSRFNEVAEKIQKLSCADDYLVRFESENDSLTRFANNMVTQNVHHEEERINLTSYLGAKKATLTTADLTDEGIRNLVKSCEIAAQNSVVDKEYIPTLENIHQDIHDHVDENVEAMTPGDRAKHIKYATERSKNENATVFGIMRNGINNHGLSTKNGVHKFYRKSFVEYKNTVDINGEKSSSHKTARYIKNLSTEELFDEALKDAINMQKRKTLKPGKYSAVISSMALNELYLMMSYYGLDRKEMDLGYSAFTGKLGKKIADNRVNIFCDPDKPEISSQPFSEEGLPIKEHHIIKDGILQNVPTTRFWAKEKGLHPWTISNLIMTPGNKSDQELVSQVERGFYIKELWYIRLVKNEDLTMTGMTRNALYYIEDGKIKSGATHFRWNDSPLRMLERIEDIGTAQGLIAKKWGIPTMIPSLLVKDFYLSSNTLF